MYEDRKKKLESFVAWVRQHITGDEKGQAQIFLDRMFQAFGQKGSLDIGGSPEFRVRKAAEDGGGVSLPIKFVKPTVACNLMRVGNSRRFCQQGRHMFPMDNSP